MDFFEKFWGSKIAQNIIKEFGTELQEEIQGPYNLNVHFITKQGIVISEKLFQSLMVNEGIISDETEIVIIQYFMIPHNYDEITKYITMFIE